MQSKAARKDILEKICNVSISTFGLAFDTFVLVSFRDFHWTEHRDTYRQDNVADPDRTIVCLC